MSFIPCRPTRLRGVDFRSRLESRWAFYLSALHIPWEYEPSAFCHEGVNYVPDFLINGRFWAEVKPREFDDLAWGKVCRLVTATGQPCVLLVGPPEARPYSVLEAVPVAERWYFDGDAWTRPESGWLRLGELSLRTLSPYPEGGAGLEAHWAHVARRVRMQDAPWGASRWGQGPFRVPG